MTLMRFPLEGLCREVAGSALQTVYIMKYMSHEVGVAELRKNLSAYLLRAARGERVTVTDRHRPVAQLGPVPDEPTAMDRLIAEGRVDPPLRRGPLLPPLPADDRDRNGLSRALFEQRADEER